MQIITGRYAGRTGTLHQFANDWMTVDIPGERSNAVVSPGDVKLDAEEIAKVRAANPASLGQFWQEWQMYDDGTFIARQRDETAGNSTGNGIIAGS